MAPVATKVYDDNDNLISEFFIERRELAKLERIPHYLKDGVICIEDKAFYKHWGIDLLALIRAMITKYNNNAVSQKHVPYTRADYG
jgi:penicillin-binding protein 1A